MPICSLIIIIIYYSYLVNKLMYFIILAKFLVTTSLNNSLIFFFLHQICVFMPTYEYYMHAYLPLFFDTSMCMVVTDLPSYSRVLCSVAASSLLLSPLNVSLTFLLYFSITLFPLVLFVVIVSEISH